MTVYLDHNATSPTDAAHFKAVLETIGTGLGNPSSPHSLGRNGSVVLSDARKKLSHALQFDVSEIIFVSGASEANNLATVGVLNASGVAPLACHAIYSAMEHPSIREPLQFFERKHSAKLDCVSADAEGFVDLRSLIERIQPGTLLLTLMAANNEVGTLQNVRELGDWLHERRWAKLPRPSPLDAYLNPAVTREQLQKLHFHVDAVQAFGKVTTEKWMSLGIDSVSVSAHKLGGLTGIGALALRKGRRFEPLVLGGAQERNRRGGTENLLGIASFGLIAGETLKPSWWEQTGRCAELRNKLATALDALPGMKRNSHLHDRALPNTLHYTLVHPKVRGEDLLMQLDLEGIAVSSGSACSSGANLPSKVMLAMGRNEADAKNSVRISLGHSSSVADIERAIAVFSKLLI